MPCRLKVSSDRVLGKYRSLKAIKWFLNLFATSICFLGLT